MCFCLWMGEWVETGVGAVREMRSKDGKNNHHCHQNILLKDEGVHPTAVSTVQHILHIYIYQVFPNSLVFVLKSHTKMSGKAVTGKLIFLVMFAKLFSKFCVYIINQAEELTVITNVIIWTSSSTHRTTFRAKHSCSKAKKAPGWLKTIFKNFFLAQYKMKHRPSPSDTWF